MRSVNLYIPYIGKKTRPIKIVRGDHVLTFMNTIGNRVNYQVVLANRNKHQKHISTEGYNLSKLQISLEGFDWFWIERVNLFGRGGEIIAVIKENL